MKNKIVGICICMLMIVATVLPVTSTSNLDNIQLKEQSVSSNDKSPVSLQANHCLWSGVGSNLMNTAITPSIDLSAGTTCVLTLWKQYDISSPDFGAIEISTNGGATWTNLEVIDGYQADWIKNSIDLSAYTGNSNVKIQFVYYTQSSSQSNGWHVDEISIIVDGSAIYGEDFETGAPGWILNGWTIVEKHAPPSDTTTKWEQLPDTNQTGIDIMDMEQFNQTLSDDFLCISTGPITDIHLWGSWLGDVKGTITKIHLSIHADIPANNSPSRPGTLLWQRDFYQGDFTETIYLNNSIYEWWWDPYTNTLVPNADHNIWQIDINIPQNNSFIQQGTESHPIVYWLDVSVNAYNGSFGWKTAKTHWNDDAVMYTPWYTPPWQELRYPYGHPYVNQSIDMAFRITTPTPKCCFKITWPTYNQTVKCACFKINFTETCNEKHINVPWSITITNHGPGMLRCLPPFSPPLAPTQSRTYSHVFFMFGAGKTKTRCSPILWAAIYYPPYPPGVPGLRSITITVTVDGCPPVMQTAKVGWFTISIP